MFDELDTEAAQAILADPALSDAVRADLAREVESRDFGAFHQAVMAKIAEVSAEQGPAGALDAETLRALSVTPEPPGDLSAAVMEKISALPDASLPAVVRGALIDEAAAVVAEREGQWASFLEEVMERVEADVEGELETLPLAMELVRSEAEQVVAERDFGAFASELRPEEARFRDEVVRELRSVDRRFEREFQAGVAKKLEPELGRRRPRGPSLLKRWGRQLGSMAVAAAAMLAISLEAPLEQAQEPFEDVGEVTVDAVRFDGNMTVTQDQGVAVIWLDDADDDDEDDEPVEPEAEQP